MSGARRAEETAAWKAATRAASMALNLAETKGCWSDVRRVEDSVAYSVEQKAVP
jgi:hypothetical protein